MYVSYLVVFIFIRIIRILLSCITDSISVSSQIHISQVLEYVFHGCAYAYEYEYCAALVAISEAQQHLVVAFRGTSGNRQPIEQALSTFGWMVDFGYDLLGKVRRLTILNLSINLI